VAVQRNLPSTANADSLAVATTPSRTGTYLEAYSLPLGGGDLFFGDEGSYYHCCNVTLGTAIAGHAAPVVADADTKALLHIYNSGTKRIYPVYLHLEVTAAGTAGTSHYTTVYVDDKGSTALTSGGTTITPVNVNAEGTNTTGAIVTFGAAVVSMTSSRKVFQQIVRTVIPVVGDTLMIRFGSSDANFSSALATAGTAIANVVQYAPPVVVGPGGNFNVAQIRPSQSAAASYQFSFGYLER
jgi:hypothetical protein